MAKRKLIKSILEQKEDQGLANGRVIVEKLDEHGKKEAIVLAASAGKDFINAMQTFSASGQVGRALARSAAPVTGNHLLDLPKFESLHGDVDPEQLLAALFDPRFSKALYQFQLVLAKSTLEQQQILVRNYAAIDWAKFNFEDQGWWSKTLGLIGAGMERNRVHELSLQDVIPLMKVPCVLDMVTISSGYAMIMDAALKSYYEDREFLHQLGLDNEEVLDEIDALLERIENAEAGRLARFQDVVDSTKQLHELLKIANLVADLTNRSTEAQTQKAAGRKLATALSAHSTDTLEAQEAYLQHFMRLNQILISNQVREGHLSSAMASLNLYVKSYQAFVLMLTSLQVYLLTASSALKKYLGDQLDGASAAVAEQIYATNVAPLKASLGTYAGSFARIKPGQSRREALLAQASKVVDLPSAEKMTDEELAGLGELGNIVHGDDGE